MNVGTVEAREHRERELEWMATARRKARVPAATAEPADLQEALRVEVPIGIAALREVAARAYGQAVVSLYLGLQAQKVVRRPPALASVFNSLRHGEVLARRELVDRLSRSQRSQLERDLDEIQELLHGLDPQGMRSLVVFKSGPELNHVWRLPVGAADSLSVDIDPYIVPLEAILEEYAPALVVEVSREDSQFWGFHLGRLDHVESLNAFGATSPVDAGRPGKVQRHRLTHLLWHLRSTSQLADRLLAERGFELLVLSGDEQVVAQLERLVPDRVRTRIIGRLHPSPHVDRGEWRLRIERLVAEHRRDVEEAVLARLGEYQGRGVLTVGLESVLEAANLFLVRKLFVAAELTRPGWVCRQHHFLALREGRCPFDGSELLPAENVINELIEFARLHGVDLMLVEQRSDLLEPHGGVAAVTYELQTA